MKLTEKQLSDSAKMYDKAKLERDLTIKERDAFKA